MCVEEDWELGQWLCGRGTCVAYSKPLVQYMVLQKRREMKGRQWRKEEWKSGNQISSTEMDLFVCVCGGVDFLSRC